MPGPVSDINPGAMSAFQRAVDRLGDPFFDYVMMHDPKQRPIDQLDEMTEEEIDSFEVGYLGYGE